MIVLRVLQIRCGSLCNNDELSLEGSSSDHSSSDESSGNEFSSDESDLESIVGDAESDIVNVVPTLEWREGAGESLKRPYGFGSESTRKRQRRHERGLKRAASILRIFSDDNKISGYR
jgi:hypothetical protein